VKLRAAESIRPVSIILHDGNQHLPAVRRYPVRPRRRLLWALPTAGHGVRKPSGRRWSQPDRDRRHPVGPGTADILSAPGTTDISLALPAIG